MIRVWRGLAALPGVLFVGMGLRWLIDPSGAAAGLGMTLFSGVGLSSQIGDMASFFTALGALTLAGVSTMRRYWFYGPVLLLVLAAMFRVFAWLFHDAALALALIIPEVFIAAWLWLISGRFCDQR